MKFSVVVTTYNQIEQVKKFMRAWEAQTVSDFELIIADDGSSDGTLQWLESEYLGKTIGNNAIVVVTQPDNGYRYTEIFNKGANVARGEYIVSLTGDSYPKPDFLEQLGKVVKPDRFVGGIRINVNDKGLVVGADWRLHKVTYDLTLDEIKVDFVRPWELMTGNALCMPKKVFKDVGGFSKVYDEGYGRMDWSVCMKAYYSGVDMYWMPKAIIYHIEHPSRDDTENSIQAFELELKEWQGKSVRANNS